MVEGIMKKMEDMHSNMKNEIKATNQCCEKSFEEYARRINLHDTALKSIETQLGQLSQAVQGRNNAAFLSIKKGPCSKGRSNIMLIEFAQMRKEKRRRKKRRRWMNAAIKVES